MSMYISLLNWTDQGIRAYKDTTQRAAAFNQAMERLGGKVVSLYWTLGPYDLVAIVDAPDDATATAALLQLGSVGNIRSVSMRAFDADQMNAIVAKAAG